MDVITGSNSVATNAKIIVKELNAFSSSVNYHFNGIEL